MPLRRWVLPIIVALAFGGLAGALTLSILRTQERANAGVVHVKDLNSALTNNCHLDLRYKRQYKARAGADRRSLRIQARVDRRLARVSFLLSHGLDKRTDRLLKGLAHIAGRSGRAQLAVRRRIHIIPLRGYCAQIQRVAQTAP